MNNISLVYYHSTLIFICEHGLITHERRKYAISQEIHGKNSKIYMITIRLIIVNQGRTKTHFFLCRLLEFCGHVLKTYRVDLICLKTFLYIKYSHFVQPTDRKCVNCMLYIAYHTFIEYSSHLDDLSW